MRCLNRTQDSYTIQNFIFTSNQYTKITKFRKKDYTIHKIYHVITYMNKSMLFFIGPTQHVTHCYDYLNNIND